MPQSLHKYQYNLSLLKYGQPSNSLIYTNTRILQHQIKPPHYFSIQKQRSQFDSQAGFLINPVSGDPYGGRSSCMEHTHMKSKNRTNNEHIVGKILHGRERMVSTAQVEPGFRPNLTCRST